MPEKTRSAAATLLLRSADEDTLLAWFLGEIADTPFWSWDQGDQGDQGGPLPFQYAASVLQSMDAGQNAHDLDAIATIPSVLQPALQDKENRKTLEQARSERNNGVYKPYFLRLPLSENEDRLLRISPRPIYTGDGQLSGALATLDDVTDLRRNREVLGAGHEKFRVLFETLPIGITISDAEGKILEVNPASEKILGMKTEEHTGRTLSGKPWDIIRQDGSPMPDSEFPSVIALKTGCTCTCEEMGIRHSSGEVRWLSVIAVPLPLPGHGVVVSYADVTERHKANEALRDKERRYRLAVEAGKVCIWEWDLDSDAMYLDPMFNTMLGYEPEPLIQKGEEWLDLIHPEDRPALLQALRDHIEGRAPIFESEHRKLHQNGDVVWITSRGVMQPSPHGGTGVLSGSDLNITERKAAEQAVEQERRRLFSLLDRLPAFVSLLSPAGEIRFANRFFHDAFHSPEELAAYEAMHAGPPGEPGPLQELFEVRSLSIWEWRCEETGRHYQVYGYPYEDTDGLPLALELGIDITSSKKAQEALLASEERYRSIAESLAMGLAIVDESMRLEAANPRLREWLPHVDFNATPDYRDIFAGCSPSPGQGDKPGAAGDPHTPQSEAEPSHGCPVTLVRNYGYVYEALHDVQTPAGTRRMQATYSPVFSPDGKVGSVIVLVEDVTEKLEVQARLQRAQKLEALGTLAGGIAHEINQPLNALQLYASGLEMLVEKDHHFDRETLLTRLGWILRETGRIHEIITHMRALVRQEATPSRPAASDTQECVRDALSLLQAQLKAHNIGIEVEAIPTLPPAQANAVQLEQVVINLVVNAMQALDSVNRQDKRILVQTSMQGDRLALSVHDNGPGLQDFGDRVFDPFFTSKEAGSGMGLGLSIVHTFVTSWGGEIHSGTSDMGGAVFTVLLHPAA